MYRNKIRLYNLSHCTYVCQYHLVWVVKYRQKLFTDYLRRQLKLLIKSVAKWKKIQILQWHVSDDHVHLYLIIPPKYSVSYVVQIMKGKTSAWIKKKTKKLPKGSLWTRGYFVSTVGINEHQIRNYITNQNKYRKDLQKLPIDD